MREDECKLPFFNQPAIAMSLSPKGILKSTHRLVRRLAHVVARPVKKDRGSGGVLIQAYRGYGSSEEVFLMGRVFRQPRIGLRFSASFAQHDLLDVVRRVFRRGVADAVIMATFDDKNTTSRVPTDRDGYFEVRMRPTRPPKGQKQWHAINLRLIEPAQFANDLAATTQGQVFTPPSDARRVVISDIDDTVMFTGVVNKIKMVWRLFSMGPKSRVAFPGVASLYRALHQGPSKTELNPMLYVSRGPWSIYEILQEFFRLHRIPVGPILFLREWGMSLQRPLPPRAEDHKLNLIRGMLKLYHDMPFVLFGDSGQHDPEIYAQIVQENPGRVEAVYIRNVTRSGARANAIEELAKQVVAAGSSLMLAGDSFAMAQHAADYGLISPAALDEILREQKAQDAGQITSSTKNVSLWCNRNAKNQQTNNNLHLFEEMDRSAID